MVHHLRKDSGYRFPHLLGYRELTVEPTVKFGALELRDLMLPQWGLQGHLALRLPYSSTLIQTSPPLHGEK